MKVTKKVMLGLATAFAVTGAAQAANVAVSGDITTSQTWTADNVYNLVGQVYVKNGATLTIEAGTQIRSVPTDQGSLAITRGSKIIARGTATSPIVFTSTNDDGITPRTAVNEWGNLTLMGNALIGAEFTANGGGIRSYNDGDGAPTVTNTGTPTGLNKATMEGLTPDFVGDPDVLYGGADDNDDSGSLQYVSTRYTGKVVGLNNELNGMSLGGIGRETDINNVDVYCNVDDGFEIWGGTVNIKYFSIWNIGDDSFDVDQGWRGTAQFGLIVQGYAANASQGSGVGDNVFEIDGAEANNAVPNTTTTIYNVTVIGQRDGQSTVDPGAGSGGDHVFTFRDNSRVQYRNILVINGGSAVVQEEDSEGGTTLGWRYGTNGVPAFTNAADGVWGLPYTSAWDINNATTGGHPNNTDYLGSGVAMDEAQLIQLYGGAQSAGDASIGQGFLCEVTDTLIYNAKTSGFATADLVGVTVNGGSNPAKAVVVQTDADPLPIKGLTFGTAVNPSGSLWIANVATIDPRRNPANTATESVAAAPANGFYTPAQYRGAFSDKVNWAKGWTAADEFGQFVGDDNPADPAAELFLAAATCFQTESGCVYVIECSADGKVWEPLTTIVGDGTLKFFADFDNKPLASNKLYRVSIQ